MPRLSPEELNTARVRKAQERVAEEARQAEEEEREYREAQARMETYQARLERVRLMKSRQEHLLSGPFGKFMSVPAGGRYGADLWRDGVCGASPTHAYLPDGPLSVVNTLYEEMDKLSRKWPDMPVSKLQLDKTNKAVRAVRELLKDEGDDFLEDVNELVAAGDSIESRDVVLTLSELRSALHRLPQRYQEEWRRLEREQRELLY